MMSGATVVLSHEEFESSSSTDPSNDTSESAELLRDDDSEQASNDSLTAPTGVEVGGLAI